MEVKVEDRTGEAIEAMKNATRRALEIIGLKMEGYAKDGAPVGTPESTGVPGYMGGTLRNSITYTTRQHEGRTIKVTRQNADPHAADHGGSRQNVSCNEDGVVMVGTNVYYGLYVELNHRPAAHFLKRSVQDHQKQYMEIWKNELSKRDV